MMGGDGRVCKTYAGMTCRMPVLLQVRDVPDEAHMTLKARAAAAGISLSEYVLRVLERAVGRPTPAELAALGTRGRRALAAERGYGALAAGARRVTVVDSSGIVDFLLGTGVARRIETLLEQEGELAAPDLLVFEVLAVLRREAARRLGDARARGAIHDLADVPLALFPSLALS